MNKRIALFFSVIASSVAVHAAPAWAVFDVFNTLAPGSLSYDLNAVVVARKADGTIWQKNIQPVASSWFSKGVPSVGTSSGPQMGHFHNFVTGARLDYIVVRGTDGNIWETHSGSAWVNTFGQPPGGTTSGPMVGWDDQLGMAIVVRGAGNIPFIRKMDATTFGTGVDLLPWQQAGTTATIAAPGVTMFGTDYDAFALMSPANDIQQSVCGFPTCFASWTSLGGGLISSVSATKTEFGSPLGSRMTIASVGADSAVWVNTFNSGWSGWTFRGGGVTATPTVWYFSMGNNGPWLVARGTDGTYWINGAGTSWTSISAP